MFTPCIVVPVFDHEGAIAGTVASLAPHGLTTFLVDDGSHAPCARELDRLAATHGDWVHLVRLAPNQGKGAAVMAGFEAAAAAGFSHAVQIDADGQHDATDVPRLLGLARAHPRALAAARPAAGVPRRGGDAPGRRVR